MVVGPDGPNNEKYPTDNLGRRYDAVERGDTAVTGVTLTEGMVRTSWYIFPPPQPGAISFTFRTAIPSFYLEGIVLRR